MHFSKGKIFPISSVDKWLRLCFNDICTYDKDFDGKLASAYEAPESRRLVRAGADSISDLIPESVL